MRVIFDRSNRFCLPVHARLAPKTDLRPDRIEIGHSLLIQASKLRASNRRQPELFELRDVAARAVADIHDFLRKVRRRNGNYALTSEPLSDVSPQPSLTLRSRSLRQIKAALWKLSSPCTMAHVIIRCPRTGSNVQVWVPEDTSTDQPDAYEAVTCPACTRLYFVNRITGKLLSE